MKVRRRLLLTSALCAVAPGILAQARKIPRVAILHAGTSKEPAAAQREPFERGLRELGWIPGSTIILDYRYAKGDATKLRALADDIARSGADVIVARANAAISAARKATSTIPIVTSGYAGDPAADGVVNNVARPGGNVTGLGSFPSELDRKRLELLKDAFPNIKRVGVLLNPALDGVLAPERMNKLQAGARTLGLQVQPFEIQRTDDIAPAFAEMGKAHVDALLVRGDPLVLDPNRVDIAARALKLRLPSIYWWPFFVEAGGLMSYGDSFYAMHHRSASYVSRILKGEKPGDLPLEQPSKFDLVVNLKTAKAIGVEIPKAVMFRADRVIQ
jgi:putative tryptophan/tyrosine transport system substrate-binding protein